VTQSLQQAKLASSVLSGEHHFTPHPSVIAMILSSKQQEAAKQHLIAPRIVPLQYLVETMVKEAGHGFGELALLHKSNRRAATAYAANGPVHIATLSKQDFQRVFQSQVEQSLQRLVDFLITFRICQDINRQTLSKMSYYLKEHQYRRGAELYREGELSTGIFFIKEGDFEVRYLFANLCEITRLNNNIMRKNR
jgi:CRP-like cAMP-binding protein